MVEGFAWWFAYTRLTGGVWRGWVSRSWVDDDLFAFVKCGLFEDFAEGLAFEEHVECFDLFVAIFLFAVFDDDVCFTQRAQNTSNAHFCHASVTILTRLLRPIYYPV